MLVSMHNLVKDYILPNGAKVRALNGVNLTIEQGEMAAIMGRSGHGKSTLMHIMGTLDSQTEGGYQLDGESVERLNVRRLAALRNRTIGFVFQSFNLIGGRSSLANVMMPLLYAGASRKEAQTKAMECLAQVDMADFADRKPNQISGGQRQRVAIARALANTPKLLLADEPTGSLDQETAVAVMNVFKAINAQGITVVMVTHDPWVASQTRRVITLEHGKVA